MKTKKIIIVIVLLILVLTALLVAIKSIDDFNNGETVNENVKDNSQSDNNETFIVEIKEYDPENGTDVQSGVYSIGKDLVQEVGFSDIVNSDKTDIEDRYESYQDQEETPTNPGIEEKPTDDPEEFEEDETDEVTYLEYMNMSPEDQFVYYQSYKNPEDFAIWYHKAFDEYESGIKVVIIDEGESAELQ